MKDAKKIVLIGASTRPLIGSCLQAALVPMAFDFFADFDGQRLIQESGLASASLTKIDRYSDLLECDFAKLGDAAILAGGAELRPELVEAVGRQLPLLGADAESLASIADPMQWLRVLQDAGQHVPETRRELPVGSSSDWLQKQSSTCGGRKVRLVTNVSVGPSEGTNGDCYFQKRIEGQSFSAVIVSRRQTAEPAVTTFSIGFSRQLLTSDFEEDSKPSTQPAFEYHGSVGPIMIPASVRSQIDRIAGLLAQRFSLRGVWGMDFVLDARHQVWPVDLNPRITASAELFEQLVKRSASTFRSVVDLHVAACLPVNDVPEAEFEKLVEDRFAGRDCETKRILFNSSSRAVTIDNANFQRLLSFLVPEFFRSNLRGASIADVPRPGDRIEFGRPLLTIRSRAKNEAEAVALSDKLAATVQVCMKG